MSSVMAVTLMVAITVILAAAVGSFILDFADAGQEPAPQVANADAAFLADGSDNQTVRITHEGGETVEVSDLQIVVSFSGHSERSRLVGIPTDSINASDYEGDDIWNDSTAGIGGALASDEPEGSDGRWSSGESISFRIEDDHVDVNPGETVTVTVIHAPTNKVLLERSLTARASALAPATDRLVDRTAVVDATVGAVDGVAVVAATTRAGSADHFHRGLRTFMSRHASRGV